MVVVVWWFPVNCQTICQWLNCWCQTAVAVAATVRLNFSLDGCSCLLNTEWKSEKKKINKFRKLGKLNCADAFTWFLGLLEDSPSAVECPCSLCVGKENGDKVGRKERKKLRKPKLWKWGDEQQQWNVPFTMEALVTDLQCGGRTLSFSGLVGENELNEVSQECRRQTMDWSVFCWSQTFLSGTGLVNFTTSATDAASQSLEHLLSLLSIMIYSKVLECCWCLYIRFSLFLPF